jgi:hypothetical protein
MARYRSSTCDCHFSLLHEHDQIRFYSWVLGVAGAACFEFVQQNCFCKLPPDVQRQILHECLTIDYFGSEVLTVEKNTLARHDYANLVATLAYSHRMLQRLAMTCQDPEILVASFCNNLHCGASLLAHSLQLDDIGPILAHFEEMRWIGDSILLDDRQVADQHFRLFGYRFTELGSDQFKTSQLICLYYGSSFRVIFGQPLSTCSGAEPTDLENHFFSAYLIPRRTVYLVDRNREDLMQQVSQVHFHSEYLC